MSEQTKHTIRLEQIDIDKAIAAHYFDPDNAISFHCPIAQALKRYFGTVLTGVGVRRAIIQSESRRWSGELSPNVFEATTVPIGDWATIKPGLTFTLTEVAA